MADFETLALVLDNNPRTLARVMQLVREQIAQDGTPDGYTLGAAICIFVRSAEFTVKLGADNGNARATNEQRQLARGALPPIYSDATDFFREIGRHYLTQHCEGNEMREYLPGGTLY